MRSIRTMNRGFASCLLLLAVATDGSADGPLKVASSVRTPTAAPRVRLARETTVITEPLNAAGYPDYLAALNQRASTGVTRDENFWALMWQATGNEEFWSEPILQDVERQLGITIPRGQRIQFPQLYWRSHEESECNLIQKQWDESMQRPWTRAEFPRIAGWIDAKDEPLRQIHAACQRPKAFSPLLKGDGPFTMIQMHFPHVGGLRSAGRILASRAMLRLGEQDVEGSWQDLVDLYRLAGHMERGSTLFELLVSYWCRGIVQEPMAHWISQAGLTADELQDRLAQLDPLLQTCPPEHHFESERFLFLDTAIVMTTGCAITRQLLRFENDPPHEGFFADEPLPELQRMRGATFQALILSGDADETLRYGHRLYDEVQAVLQLPQWSERQSRLSTITARIEQDARIAQGGGTFLRTYLFGSRHDTEQLPARVLIGLLLPRISEVDRLRTTSEAHAAIVRAGLLTRIYLHQNGNPPSSIADVDPQGNWNLIDPFTGMPLRLTADERGLVIYSIGPNGIDDRGFDDLDRNSRSDDPRVVLSLMP